MPGSIYECNSEEEALELIGFRFHPQLGAMSRERAQLCTTGVARSTSEERPWCSAVLREKGRLRGIVNCGLMRHVKVSNGTTRRLGCGSLVLITINPLTVKCSF